MLEKLRFWQHMRSFVLWLQAYSSSFRSAQSYFRDCLWYRIKLLLILALTLVHVLAALSPSSECLRAAAPCAAMACFERSHFFIFN